MHFKKSKVEMIMTLHNTLLKKKGKCKGACITHCLKKKAKCTQGLALRTVKEEQEMQAVCRIFVRINPGHFMVAYFFY
jgi:hypothetical protein